MIDTGSRIPITAQGGIGAAKVIGSTLGLPGPSHPAHIGLTLSRRVTGMCVQGLVRGGAL